MKPVAWLLIALLLGALGAVEAPPLETSTGPVTTEQVTTPGAAQTAAVPASVNTVTAPGLTIALTSGNERGTTSTALTLLLIITALAIAPGFLMMMTCFTRIIIVLGFVRRAIGTQTLPPNQVMLGLALFLTLFVMSPTFNRINSEALQPYLAEKISQTDALDRAKNATRDFLLKHTRKTDLALFIHIAGEQRPIGPADVSFTTLVPAFMTSELKTAFQMGFILFLPFLVIDLVISAVLMALGMMMLPPVVVSMPFKILLFVLVDGWALLMQGLVASYA
jgi:flagellar biosynthetic protein FliP